MALPTSYLTSQKNLSGILDAIKTAQAPEKFTLSFLESLEYKSSSDRLIIGVLKALGFLDDTAKPTDRYFRFLDQTQSERVLAEGIRDAYDDLFRINVNAQQMSKPDIINKFRTLSQGKISDSVLDKMAMTFTALVKLADFTGAPAAASSTAEDLQPAEPELASAAAASRHGILGGLVYNIQMVLPESRDQAVYDALFQSLRRHLL
jgi:Family of unknown function (DUF5343)